MARRGLISTPAKPDRCAKCGTGVLVGHVEGLKESVLRVPIGSVPDGLGVEASWHELGRRTFVLAGDGTLAERTPQRIEGGSIRGELYVEHRCAP